jgi:hypothetical protein
MDSTHEASPKPDGKCPKNEVSRESVPSSIHGWHHIIILYNVKAEKLL